MSELILVYLKEGEDRGTIHVPATCVCLVLHCQFLLSKHSLVPRPSSLGGCDEREKKGLGNKCPERRNSATRYVRLNYKVRNRSQGRHGEIQ